MLLSQVPMSWTWRARARVAANCAWVSWAIVGLVSLASEQAVAAAIAWVVGLALVGLLVTLRGPEPNDVAVAEALRSGKSAAGLAKALVNEEATRRLKDIGWLRFPLVAAWLAVFIGLAGALSRGPDIDRLTFWAVFSVNCLAWGWSLSVSLREARDWLGRNVTVSDRDSLDGESELST